MNWRKNAEVILTMIMRMYPICKRKATKLMEAKTQDALTTIMSHVMG
jgi:hypothetical protein